jgi:MFS family permease
VIFSVAGLGHSACWAPVVALVSKWVPDHKRVSALSFVTMGVGIGIILWGVMIPVIVSAVDWRAGWKAIGIFGGGVALLNWVLIRNPRESVHPRTSAADRIWSLWNAYKGFFRNKTFWIIGISYLLVGFNVLVPFTYLPIYAREALHLTYATSTRYIAVIAGFGIVGQITLGLLPDTVGRIRIMIGCSMIMGAGCLALTIFRSVWGVFACTAFYGLGYGAVWPVYAAAASDYFHKSKIGSVVGLWTVFLGIGSFFSPVICGWIIDTTASYSWIFILGWAGGMLSVLMLLALPRRG